MSIESTNNCPFEANWAERLLIENLLVNQPERSHAASGADVVAGLSQTPKILPPKYFYDDRGSQLFEQICDLPEYYLTRTEAAILQQYSPEIVQLTGACELVELGSAIASRSSTA